MPKRISERLVRAITKYQQVLQIAKDREGVVTFTVETDKIDSELMPDIGRGDYNLAL